MPNRLQSETSPYLLQHANNPVDWYPWGPEALNRAREENKLILVSIGYSACHWCHVMEHESFEDEAVAELMNRSFINIKIDREERPDIDQIYMNAVQLMTGQGGWPLNCICLPDQRPIYGGTYFRKPDWMGLLQSLDDFWKNKPEEAFDYATRLTEGIDQSERLQLVNEKKEYTLQHLKDIAEPWKRLFDITEGGYNRAPKFPLPNNWAFLMRYACLAGDEATDMAVQQTLHKMAYGGIYDHIGGGFARYSVDAVWHVPHFEKMLYDNAQLISLYAEAYRHTHHEEYKHIVYQTIDWLLAEMDAGNGGFYAALDADSEGVEGKYYTFTESELASLLNEQERAVFNAYFNVSAPGNWEEEHTNIFFRRLDDDQVAYSLGISVLELHVILQQAKAKVKEYRSKRVRPGTDTKVLVSWNAMLARAFTDTWRVFEEERFLGLALQSVTFLDEQCRKGDALLRQYGGSQPTEGFLDDYAFTIEAFIHFYEATFDEKWLLKARTLTDYVLKNFSDEKSGMLFYTSATGEQLISRKQEVLDNVIPSSNSVMADNLYKLGHFFDNEPYTDMARQMLANVEPHIKSYASAYSNWCNILLYEVFGLYEVAITGTDAEHKRREFEEYYIPNKIILGGLNSSLPLLKDKAGTGTKLYICKNRTCGMPVTEVTEAIAQIKNDNKTE